MENNVLKIENFSLAFGENQIFKNLNLELRSGIYIFSGPSGVGKSTLMRAIAGLNTNYTGTISVNGKKCKGCTPLIHMVHQHYTSYPWLDCLDNVLMVYKGHGIKVTKEIRQSAVDILERLGLGEHANKRPGQLSGGQDQRLSIGSALINDMSPIILYDEMTSALDEKNDFLIVDLIKEHQARTNNIVIVITHEEHVKDGLIEGDTSKDIFFSEEFRLN